MTPLEQLENEFLNEYSFTERSTPDLIQEYIRKAYELGHEQGEISAKGSSSPCPLTNSSHEKSLVRVVDKHVLENTPERACSMHVSFIQVLCVCGHIISEAEIKSK